MCRINADWLMLVATSFHCCCQDYVAHDEQKFERASLFEASQGGSDGPTFEAVSAVQDVQVPGRHRGVRGGMLFLFSQLLGTDTPLLMVSHKRKESCCNYLTPESVLLIPTRPCSSFYRGFRRGTAVNFRCRRQEAWRGMRCSLLFNNIVFRPKTQQR